MFADFKKSFTVGLAVNWQRDSCHISYCTLNVSLHYLVKYKGSTIAMLLMYLTQ